MSIVMAALAVVKTLNPIGPWSMARKLHVAPVIIVHPIPVGITMMSMAVCLVRIVMARAIPIQQCVLPIISTGLRTLEEQAQEFNPGMLEQKAAIQHVMVASAGKMQQDV